ncbi:hypothetical protein WJX72_001576 [[Myrmecia] bisecta]|uniref:Meckelin n=1 Tax=[Myrmecia] bisecta TaxID=41462 RepID=A0AAW1QE68_9CHLO
MVGKTLGVLYSIGLLLLQGPRLATCASGFSLQLPCGPGQVLDTTGLQCANCNPNGTPDSTQTSCQCNPGHISGFAADTAAGVCTSCPAGQVSSSTGLYCVVCDPTSGTTTSTASGSFVGGSMPSWLPAQASNGECVCANNATAGQIAEFDNTGAPLMQQGVAVKRCLVCPAGSVLNPSTLKCEACNYPASVQAGQCVWCGLPGGPCTTAYKTPLDFVIANLSLPLAAASATQASFANVPAGDGGSSQVPVAPSQPLATLLGTSAAACLQLADKAACNALANLCVLQMYASTSAACQIMQKLGSARSSMQYHSASLQAPISWPVTLPWLYYPTNVLSSILEATDVKTQMSFSAGGATSSGVTGAASRLDFVVSMYALNGTWLGLRNVTTQLQLCGGETQQLASWHRFGTNYKLTCHLDLEFLADESGGNDGPIFYDMYFQDGLTRLYPVPVLVQNYQDGSGAFVNTDSIASNDQLTRRFFMVDQSLGTGAGAGSASVLQYARAFKLTITLRHDQRSSIYPPLLTLQYAARDVSQLSMDNPASFEVLYTMDSVMKAGFWSAWNIMLIVFLIVAGFAWMARMLIFMRIRRDQNIDMQVLLQGLVTGVDVAGKALFVVLLLASLYWCCFFKLQGSVMTMMLQDSEIQRFKLVIVVAFIFQAITVAAIIQKQAMYDMFFIDWEKPRRVVARGGGREETAPVSCWRSLFITNEWNELQAERMTMPAVTLFALAFILAGLGVDSTATISPNATDTSGHDYLESSQLLRFGIATGFFLALGLVQVLFKKLVYHQYVCNPLHDFVDLLFLSNISCVILDTRHSGYYIHGRNQAQFSDTNLQDLNASLLKEEEGLVANRGLVSSERHDIRENQTFKVYITKKLRDKYESTMLRQIQQLMDNTRARKGYVSTLLNGPGRAGEKMVHVRDELNTDFKTIVAQVENNAATQVLEPLLLQRIMQMPPEIANTKPAFVHDFHNSFDAVLFYGCEAELLLFDILLFAVIDMSSQNTTLAASLTYLVWVVVKWIREKVGQNNISRKTMVDSHFLV